MQFSIFGVPFGCTKDMFTWEKIRSTCFINWAILWRSTLLIALIFSPILYLVYFLIKNNNLSVISITVAMLCLISLMVAYYYIKHSVLYEISFRTMKRQFIKDQTKPKFMCWQFWKPQLVAFALYFLALVTLLIVIGIIMYILFTNDLKIGLLIFAAGGLTTVALAEIILKHVILHSGIFGFVIEVINEETSLILDQPPSIGERIKLSLIFWFTSFGCLIAVGMYFNYVENALSIFKPYIVMAATHISTNIWVIYTFTIVALIIMILPTILFGLYTHYDALYKFPYKSTSRMYTSLDRAPKRWSLRFLGTYALMFVLTLLPTIGLAHLIFKIFDEYELNDVLVYGICAMISSMTVSVSLIAFGAWGFVPVRKQPCALPGKQE